jgi:acyl-CoA synthetase (AMP-forming)/AMP-acid ligase II
MDTGDVPVHRAELTPISFLERAGTVHAGRTAVVDGPRSYTYAEWRPRARRLASALRRAGLGRGDRVAFCALNSEPLLLAHFGVPMAGGVLVAANTRLSAGEVAYIVDHAGCRLVFYSPELAGQVARIPGSVRRIALGPEFEAFLAAGSDDEPPEPFPGDELDLIAIDYTSGTTGRPKGVMYHHRGAHLNAVAMALENRLAATSSFLWTLPMFHCNGWSHTWALPAVGAKSVCIPRIDPPEVWRLLDAEGVTHFNAAPTVLIMLANDPAAHRLERRVRVCTGGAPPSPTLIAQMDAFNVELVHLYGLTECYGPFTINQPPPELAGWPLDRQAAFKARQGVPHALAGQVRVVDEAMRDLPADGRSMGEVVLRGNTVMKGYFGDVEGTAAAFAGGWFHTGDVGVMHPDGSIELRDRMKDVIISGGENISTIEVEQAVMSHPAVMEAAVVAIPDDRWGEVPKAFVTLKPGCSATAEEIVEHVRGRIAHFKAPKVVEFRELPRTSTGKIQKYVLREREWTGRPTRIN